MIDSINCPFIQYSFSKISFIFINIINTLDSIDNPKLKIFSYVLVLIIIGEMWDIELALRLTFLLLFFLNYKLFFIFDTINKGIQINSFLIYICSFLSYPRLTLLLNSLAKPILLIFNLKKL